MADLLASWDRVRVYGTWVRPDGSAMLPGRYTVSIPGRLTNATDDAIIPAGDYLTGELNVTAGLPSLDITVPATDDPDIEQSGWKLTIRVALTGGPTETYVIDVPIANRPTAEGGNGVGVNLRTIALASSIGPQVALYGVGVAGGLAKLSTDGVAVLNAEGDPITGNGGGPVALADLPAGSVVVVYWTGTAWTYGGQTVTARPTSRTDVTVNLIDPIGDATAPSWAITGDLFDQVPA